MVGIKLIKKLLSDRKHRWQHQLFWVDGANFIHQAIANNWEIDTLVYAPTLINTDFKKNLINQIPAKMHLKVEPGEYAYLSAKQDIQGIGAVVKMKYQTEPTSGSGVVLEHLSNPGNVGNILRTCIGFDVSNIYIINPAVDPFSFESVRASMGAIFHCNLILLSDVNKLKNHKNIGTSLDGKALNDSMINGEIMIWFGNEAKGLTPEAKKMCQSLLKVPISPKIDSLNVAECAAIVLYELFANSSFRSR